MSMTRTNLLVELRRLSENFSPKFGLAFRVDRRFLLNNQICLWSINRQINDSIVVLTLNEPTTPARIESWLLRTVGRTKFVGPVVHGPRYTVDFSKLDPWLLGRLFHYVLTSAPQSSWLEPLQAMIINYKPVKSFNPYDHPEEDEAPIKKAPNHKWKVGELANKIAAHIFDPDDVIAEEMGPL